MSARDLGPWSAVTETRRDRRRNPRSPQGQRGGPHAVRSRGRRLQQAGHATCAALVASLLCACAETHVAAPAPKPAAAPDVASVLVYLPLVHDTVLTYDTHVESTGERGLLMMQVRRPRDGRVDLTVGGKVQRLEIGDDAVRYVGGGTVLRRPLEIGTTWRGNLGVVRITRTDVDLSTPAGDFAGCIETREEVLRGSTGQRVTTVFCPDVGIAQLVMEVTSPTDVEAETATLRSYEKRVDIYQLSE